MKTKKRSTSHNRRTAAHSSDRPVSAALPFVEHLHELRRRLYYVAASVFVWGCAAYGVQQKLVHILLSPSKGQHFIYTSPGGGIDFLFRICIYVGLIFSLPVIVYNMLRFIEPIITKSSRQFMLWGSLASGILAAGGILFGYFLGLPAALHFLLHQFTTAQIQPLVTIQSYLGFVIVYMVGSAMLFQLPLMLIFINRIKPLKPKRLLRYERWVILIAFVLAGLMNPTPNVISQLFVAGPFILMYQVGILIIAVLNRKSKTRPANNLIRQDQQLQASRVVQAQPRLQPLAPMRQMAAAVSPVPSVAMNAAPLRLKPIRRVQVMDIAPAAPRPSPSLAPDAKPPLRMRSRQEIYAMRGEQARTFNDMRLGFSRSNIQ
jgi:sec-independent protein translocase protein TatC